MVDAAVQRDVDGISKGSDIVLLKRVPMRTRFLNTLYSELLSGGGAPSRARGQFLAEVGADGLGNVVGDAGHRADLLGRGLANFVEGAKVVEEDFAPLGANARNVV